MTSPEHPYRLPDRVNVLMIEDDLEYRRLVERWLSSSEAPKFHLSFASRLDDSWHELNDSDVILLDLGLPDAAGADTLVATHELANQTPIVVLSALDENELEVRAEDAGASVFLPKRRAEPQSLRDALCRALIQRGGSGGRSAGESGSCSKSGASGRSNGFAST